MPTVTDPGAVAASEDFQYNHVETSGGETPGAADDTIITVSRVADDGETIIVGELALSHSPDEPMAMSVADMVLHLTTLTAALQAETVKIADGMIEQNKDVIREKSAERIEKFKEVERLLDKLETKRKRQELIGWGVVAAGVLLTVATMGTAGPIMVSLMVVGTAASITSQSLSSAGVYEKLAEDDPTAHKALYYGLMSVQIACSLGCMGVGVYKAATAAGQAGLQAGANTVKAANTAAQTGKAMANASNAAQMADDAVSGVAKMADILRNTERIAQLEKAARVLTRTGVVINTGASGAQMVNGVEAAFLTRTYNTTQATLVEINKTTTMHMSMLQELTDKMYEMLATILGIQSAASECESKVHSTNIEVISNVGVNTAGMS